MPRTARPTPSPFFFSFPPGDVMGPTLNHLSNLLRLPFGCGEQNMIHFAPNVFVLKYLQKTRQLSPEVERETTDYLVQGTGETCLCGGCGETGGLGPHAKCAGWGRRWVKEATLGGLIWSLSAGAWQPHLLGKCCECQSSAIRRGTGSFNM